MKSGYLILFILLIACNRQSDKGNLPQAAGKMGVDTLIGSMTLTDEIAGSAYRKQAKAYFLIIGDDTSDFRSIVTEAKEDNQVDIEIRFRRSMSYTQQMRELGKLLPAGAADFSYDSLTSISIGRLITTGDLAVALSRDIKWNRILVKDYDDVQQFLLNSKLAADFNRLLSPYHKRVKHVGVEKAFLADKRILFANAEVESDSSAIPDKILDCITWLQVK